MRLVLLILNTKPGSDITRLLQNTSTTKDCFLDIAGSYELDLWGRIRSEKEVTMLELSCIG